MRHSQAKRKRGSTQSRNIGSFLHTQISAAKLNAIHRRHSLKRRKPELSFARLLASMVYHVLMGRGTIQRHVKEMTSKKLSGSALSQRKQGLCWTIFEEILDVALKPRASQDRHPQAFYKGLRLIGLDGTSFGLVNVPDLVRRMGKAASRRFRAAFAQVRMSALVELGLHNPIAAAIGREKESEMVMGWKLLEKLPPRSLLLIDRLYGVPSFIGGLLARCLEMKSQYLVRVRKNLTAQMIEVLADGSAVVALKTRDEDGVKVSFLVREIRGKVRKRSGGWVTVRLWTSLMDARKYPATELLALYAQRWEVEITIKELKVELRGSDRLQSYTLETACQEIAALLLAQSILVEHRTVAAHQAQASVLRISYAQTLRAIQGLWTFLEVGQGILSPAQVVAMIRRARKLAAIDLSDPRRHRSCPRELRQPVSSWPRLIRNRSWNGEITHEVIAFSNSKS